jgi:hypothetical protein
MGLTMASLVIAGMALLAADGKSRLCLRRIELIRR